MKDETETKNAVPSKPVSDSGKTLAVVRVRGLRGVRSKTKRLLEKMGLTRKNHCVLLKDGPSVLGMLRKAKDYITWGEASEKSLELLRKKGQAPFALHPPSKGMGAVKSAFPKGALGNRQQAINQLIEKMV